MNFLRNLDLYKGLILACVLLLPVAGWWIFSLQGRIDACTKALQAAIKESGPTNKDGGLIEQIGSLQRSMELIKSNREIGNSVTKPSEYFDRQILLGVPGISSGDFRIPPERETPSGRNSVDIEVEVDFLPVDRGAERPFTRDMVYAILFNCESGAGSNRGAAAGSSIWKLRKIMLENATSKDLQAYKTPPKELEDKWFIKDLKFARRAPRTGK